MEKVMSFSELSDTLGARLFAGEGKQTADFCSDFRSMGFSSVSIDSRTLLPGALFVAIRGSSMDGHRFVEAAFKAGASGAMVDLLAMEDSSLCLAALVQKWKGVLVVVENTLKGLQNAAAAYLAGFSNLVRVGITGSSGKTTTKEIAAAIISGEKSVVMNPGNMNSETGLPLSVFNVRPCHEIGIFEAGMNHPGEIEVLAKILNPHVALITNIGSAHIGIFGSSRAIAEEKKKIFSSFTGNNTALIPADDAFRNFLAEGVRGRTVFYGPSTLPALGDVKGLGLDGTEITWGGEAVRFCLPGKFNLPNVLAAAALAGEFNISAASVRKGIASVKPLFGRGEILRGRVTLIRDCYNSNPESASMALDFCDGVEWPGRKIYVMGSMLELGSSSREAHIELGRRLASSGGDMVFLYGDEIRCAADAMEESAGGKRKLPARNFFHTSDRGELSRSLDSYVREGDLVLLKASRGCELESLTEMLLGGKSGS